MGRPEIGFGLVPGGGAFDWLPGLAGRSRALEILASGGDFDADTAERYGWINRHAPGAAEAVTGTLDVRSALGWWNRRLAAPAVAEARS
jgi:enoyl-CoA hydratase/carnithine racemase